MDSPLRHLFHFHWGPGTSTS